jgi:hypothetical protein
MYSILNLARNSLTLLVIHKIQLDSSSQVKTSTRPIYEFLNVLVNTTDWSSNIVLRQHCSTLVNEHELLNEHTVVVVIKAVV